MKKFLLLLITLTAFIACKSNAKTQTEKTPKVEEQTVAPKEAVPTPAAESTPTVQTPTPKDAYTKKTASGKVFNIKQAKDAKGKYKYIISGEGFRAPQELTTTGCGKMAEVLQADVDGNGFEEIYIISQDPLAPKITAFASYRDKSFGEINVPAVSKKLLKGYKGGDKFYIKDGKLMRSFPIYDGDKVTEKMQVLQYKLIEGEASYQLKASLAK